MVAAFIIRKVGQAEERVTCSAQPQDNDEKISSDRVQPNMRKNLFNSHRCPRAGGFSSGGGELTVRGGTAHLGEAEGSGGDMVLAEAEVTERRWSLRHLPPLTFPESSWSFIPGW